MVQLKSLRQWNFPNLVTIKSSACKFEAATNENAQLEILHPMESVNEVTKSDSGEVRWP